MPVIQISVWSGMTKENKKKLVKGLTKACEDIGIPRNAVTVIINEARKTNWAKLHSEKFSDI